jgi:hypothetical protein
VVSATDPNDPMARERLTLGTRCIKVVSEISDLLGFPVT